MFVLTSYAISAQLSWLPALQYPADTYKLTGVAIVQSSPTARGIRVYVSAFRASKSAETHLLCLCFVQGSVRNLAACSLSKLILLRSLQFDPTTEQLLSMYFGAANTRAPALLLATLLSALAMLFMRC